mgnify:CR=1 FL=1
MCDTIYFVKAAWNREGDIPPPPPPKKKKKKSYLIHCQWIINNVFHYLYVNISDKSVEGIKTTNTYNKGIQWMIIFLYKTKSVLYL